MGKSIKNIIPEEKEKEFENICKKKKKGIVIDHFQTIRKKKVIMKRLE